MTNNNQYSNNYKGIFDGLDNFQAGESLKKLMKDLDKTLERIRKSTIEESFGDYGTKRLFQGDNFAHCEEREGEEDVRFLFEDGIAFSMLKKLCEYELLQVFKETCNLGKKDVKIINKIATESTLSKEELNHISDFVKNFTEKEIYHVHQCVCC